MWKGRGRSGYGEATLQGDYDDWSGVSRNGRQYKNPATMLTSNYSGADYWHARKQMTDTYDVPESMCAVNETVNLAHCLPNGKANLLAYADKVVPVKKRSSVSLVDKILPQQKRVLTLTQQMIDLESEYKQKLHTPEEYTLLRNILSCKRQRAEVLLKKALSVKLQPTPSDDEDSFDYDERYAECSGENAAQNVIDAIDTPLWLQGVSSSNSFKKPLIKACQTYKTLVRWAIKTKHYINELKAV